MLIGVSGKLKLMIFYIRATENFIVGISSKYSPIKCFGRQFIYQAKLQKQTYMQKLHVVKRYLFIPIAFQINILPTLLFSIKLFGLGGISWLNIPVGSLWWSLQTFKMLRFWHIYLIYKIPVFGIYFGLTELQTLWTLCYVAPKDASFLTLVTL